jgi:hypothetical protein
LLVAFASGFGEVFGDCSSSSLKLAFLLPNDADLRANAF